VFFSYKKSASSTLSQPDQLKRTNVQLLIYPVPVARRVSNLTRLALQDQVFLHAQKKRPSIPAMF
jgi:hypothetical protein